MAPGPTPLFHVYKKVPVPPVPVAVAVPSLSPGQVIEVLTTVKFKAAGSVIVVVAVAVHPFPSVATTV